MLYGITFSLLGVAIIVLCLRIFCRTCMIKAIGWADYLMALAMVVTIGMCAMIHLQIKTGMGRHIEYSHDHPEMWSLSMKAGYTQNILYQSALVITKASILTQYHRIAATRTQKRVIVGTLAFVLIFGSFVTLAAIFYCIPVSAAFNISTFPKGCWNMKSMNFFTSAVNTTTDVVLFLLPMPIIAKMHISKKKKIVLFAIVASGLVVITAAAVRLSNIVLWNDAADSTYNSSVIPMLDAVEVCVAIVSGSMPALQPLFRWVFKQTLSKVSSVRTEIRLHSVSLAQGTTRKAVLDPEQNMEHDPSQSQTRLWKIGTSIEGGYVVEDEKAPICH